MKKEFKRFAVVDFNHDFFRYFAKLEDAHSFFLALKKNGIKAVIARRDGEEWVCINESRLVFLPKEEVN